MTETIWQRDDNWVGSAVEDSFVMVNINTGKYVSLNATASLVWQALESPATQGEIEARLRAEFDVPVDRCQQAVANLLGEMQKLELAAPR